MASLSLRHIYKKYPGGVTAVSDFCLEVRDTEFIIFVGPSGCGKSTTLRMIAGLEEITEGELFIGDRLVNDVAPKDRDIAMVFQNYALYPHMTVFDNMAFGLKLRKVPKEEIKRKVEEAARILAEAKDFADETIKKVNKLSQGVHINHKELENERHKVRNKMNEAESKLALKNTRKPEKKYTAEDFHPGDAVKVLSLNLNGTVCGKPNAKGDVFVQMGILRSQVNIRDLEPVDEPVITAPNLQRMSSGKIKMSKSASISTEINLIGMTTDEAIPQLDKYLDDAYLAHLPSVRVVHGRGTGALRAAVHKHLKRLKYVKSFRLGEYGEGDTGVTIVEFK